MLRPCATRCALVLAVSLCALNGLNAAEPHLSTGIRWSPNLQAAHQESLRLNRPVLIVFGAEWCHFCTKLETQSLAHPQIVQYVNQTFVPLHLDFDASQREAEILGIKSIPCVVALTPQAELVGRLDGFASPQQVADMLVNATRMQTQIQQARFTQPAPSPTMATATRP